jgi:hypothetical protein
MQAQSQFSNWALNFWYRPVIDYSAIREWAAVPFRPKGQHIVLDEEVEVGVGVEVGSGVQGGQKVVEDDRPADAKTEGGKEVQQKVWCEDEITSLSQDIFDVSSHLVQQSSLPAGDGSSLCGLRPGDRAVCEGITSIDWDSEADRVEGDSSGGMQEVDKAAFQGAADDADDVLTGKSACPSASDILVGSERRARCDCEAAWALDADIVSSSLPVSIPVPDVPGKGIICISCCSSDVSADILSMSQRALVGGLCCEAQIAPFMAAFNIENPSLGPVHPSLISSLITEKESEFFFQSSDPINEKDNSQRTEREDLDWVRMRFTAGAPSSARLLPSLLVATDDISFLESLDSSYDTLPDPFQLLDTYAGRAMHGELEQYCNEKEAEEKEEDRVVESRWKECYIV